MYHDEESMPDDANELRGQERAAVSATIKEYHEELCKRIKDPA